MSSVLVTHSFFFFFFALCRSGESVDVDPNFVPYKAPFIATQLNSTASWRRVGGSERRDPVEVAYSLWAMTSCMMQNSHEIREFVWLYGRIDIMESWTEELENKLIEL